MGEFPEGEAPGTENTASGAEAGTTGDSTAGTAGGGMDASGESGGMEPGFEDSAGGDALPSMDDQEPVFAGSGSGETAGQEGVEAGVAGVGVPGAPGIPGVDSAEGTEGGTGEADADSQGDGSGGVYGNYPGSGGTMTPAEQVAILDAELERGMGEFDQMILEEQAAQRRAAREASDAPVQTASAGGAGGRGDTDADGYGREIGGGGYSVGGGMGGASSGGGSVPENTAKYPPPADIPNGNDDDVVARQLREAAMREPDPAVREKLWSEYRKYKGIREP